MVEPGLPSGDAATDATEAAAAAGAIAPDPATERPGVWATPATDSARLRRLLWVAAALSLLIGLGSLRLYRFLQAPIDHDLVQVPQTVPVDLALWIVRVILVGVLVAAAIVGRRWVGRVRAHLVEGQAAGLLDPDMRGADLWLARLPRTEPLGRVDPAVGRSIRSDRPLAIAVVIVAGLGGLGLLVATVAWLLAGDLVVGRTVLAATVVLAAVFAFGLGLAVVLVGRIERREAVVLGRLGSESVRPGGRRLPMGLLVAVLAYPVLLASAAQIPSLTADTTCMAYPFSCFWLTVERDQGSGDPRGPTTTIEYAVRPADGTRRGTMLVAAGGPGSGGIIAAGSIDRDFPSRVLESYDIVVYDPRGVGGSDPVECPDAALQWSIHGDRVLAAVRASTFAAACPSEAGVAPPALGRYGAATTVDDIDAIREDLGLDRFVLYAQSYGTVVAQRYAAVHGDHLDALLLDGPVDVAETTQEWWAESARSFEASLLRTFQACHGDEDCAADLPDPSRDIDGVLAALDTGRIVARFGDSDGEVRDHPMFRDGVVESIALAMYTRDGRTTVLRALASAAAGDWVPLGRLSYPGGRVVFTDDDSTFDYYATWCADFVAGPLADGSATAATDITGFLQAGTAAGLDDLRLGSAYRSGLPCLAWPGRDASAVPIPHLRTTPFPVFVLTSGADPVAPAAAARRIAADLEDGYLVESDGGPHVIFGQGDACPDDLITAFLVDGRRPAERRTPCAASVLARYTPRLAPAPLSISSARDVVRRIDEEVYDHPDFVGWDGVERIDLGCRFGGRVTVRAGEGADTVTYDGCAVFDGEALDGTGEYRFDGSATIDVASGSMTLHIEIDDAGNVDAHGQIRDVPVDVTD